MSYRSEPEAAQTINQSVMLENRANPGEAGFGRPREEEAKLLPYLNIAAVLVIMLLDALAPAGVVIGMLATVPILLSSTSERRAHVWITGCLAILGFVLAAEYGHPSAAPVEIWVPNRFIAFVSLPASLGFALLLQNKRRQALAARDAALDASELNRLLMSLLAHDLRSPLTLADQGYQYVEGAITEQHEIDLALIADVRARLQRSLRAIDMVLAVARIETQAPQKRGTGGPVALDEEISAEIEAFAYEAEIHEKRLLPQVDGLSGKRFHVDVLVLRQALAIVLDNAIRYAVPGPIEISATAQPHQVQVRVRDQGPGLSAHRRGDAPNGGTGLGLRLCESLLTRAGGSLRVERDAADGSLVCLQLPARPDPTPAPQRDLSHVA